MSAATPKSTEKLRCEVREKFADIRGALHMREKLLLRQIDVIAASQQQAGCESKEAQFLVDPDEEEELLALIRSLGRFQLDSMNLALQDVCFRNEDYIAPTKDHETMYKCLQQSVAPAAEMEDTDVTNGPPEEAEAIVVDFAKNKPLIEHNAKNMYESIINITLQEAKQLIKKAKLKRETPMAPLNLEEMDDELESSMAEAVSSLGRESSAKTRTPLAALAGGEDGKKGKKSRCKPKITINNCNGTINLRNISNLTINCATEESISADIPVGEEQGNKAASVCEADRSASQSKCNKSGSKSNRIGTGFIVNPNTVSTGNTTPSTTTSGSNFSSNSSSRSQSKKQKNKKKLAKSAESNAHPTSSTYPYDDEEEVPVEEEEEDEDNSEANAVTCDFYNRLLNEIKHSLKEKSIRTLDNAHYLRAAPPQPDSTCDTNSNTQVTSTTASSNAGTTTATTQPNEKRLVLKNFENLKIILETNSDEDSFHPVQIEQWLAEIISETDLEPMQNTDILEHSKVCSGESGT